MKYYLFFSYGSCQEGSCDYGIEEYDSYEGACARSKVLSERHGWDNLTVRVFYGQEQVVFKEGKV